MEDQFFRRPHFRPRPEFEILIGKSRNCTKRHTVDHVEVLKFGQEVGLSHKHPLFGCRRPLPQVEPYLDIQRGIHRHTILHCGTEAPFLECLNGVLIQTEAEAADEVNHVDLPVSPDNGLEHDSALISRPPGFLGILGFNTIDDRWRTDVAAEGTGTVTTAAIFASTNARPFTIIDASTLTAISNTAAIACAG